MATSGSQPTAVKRSSTATQGSALKRTRMASSSAASALLISTVLFPAFLGGTKPFAHNFETL